MQNHFELFHLPVTWTVDLAKLESAYRAVQKQVHPDNFATASSAEKRAAMQWSMRANEAYQTLKDRLRRAIYLSELQGIDLQLESNTYLPPDFLMQQIEWREAFAQARRQQEHQDTEQGTVQLTQLQKQIRQHEQTAFENLEQAFLTQNLKNIRQQLRQLLFLQKLLQEFV